jgi:hypothetical protein
MKAKRWTLGVVLAAAVSLFGLIQADASPFSTYILTDDLGNQVNGTAPEHGDWETDTGSDVDDNGDADNGGSTDSGGSAGGDNNGHGNNEDGVDSSNPAGGKDNNGHGNNEDGVDSSNPGQGNGGPNGAVDESCDGSGDCIDDEIKNGSDTAADDSTTTEETKTNNGKGKGKKK